MAELPSPSAKELISKAAAALADAGIDEAIREAEDLMLFALCITREKLYAHNPSPTPEERERFSIATGRRMRREPMHYITGRVEFAGLELSIRPGVLVPRPETEMIVEEACTRMPDARRVLDLCTGSGALALAIGARLKTANITATDISPLALECARDNVRALGLDNVSVRDGALYGTLWGPVEGLRFDIIVSNPPYIPSAEISTLMPEVSVYEPRIALDGGPDGLEFYRLICAGAREHLEHGGILILELGAGQAEAVSKMAMAGGLRVDDVLKDLAGHERVLVATA